MGEQSAARPAGAELRRVRHLDTIAEVAKGAKLLAIDLCILLQIFFGGVFRPPYNPPRRAAHSAGRTQEARTGRLEIDQNFDHFFDSIFDRFWAVLGRQVGVMLGPFGGQDRPRSVQNASWKLINIKNVNFHQTLARVYGSAHLDPKTAPKMPQDRPKTAPRGS